MDIFKRISEHRAESERLAWTGTFKEYVELLRRDPTPAMTAHARVYEMIASHGVEEADGHKRYAFFEKEIFGLDRDVHKLVEEYFHSAAKRLDVRKRILLLMGPVSGGKSTLVTMLKRGLEQFSRTEKGAVYAIKGCPMHEEPLHLIPHELRAEVEQELGVRIEGNLCPACQMRLRTEYGNDIERVPVERVLISEENRIGIGTFSPSDPKSQDIADLTGSIDFSTITEYGSESDPRAYRFDGELNKANRGLMEFQEMLKCDEKFLWNLLSLTQEGNFKAGRYALISADELIVAHTNESEYKAFIANKKNEALQSRMIVMPIPYNLKVSEEEKIYAKLINQSDMKHVHIAPHALRAAAIFSILTRLKESKKQGMDLVKKMRMYDGEEVEGYKENDLKEMQSEFSEEGMSGVDPRYVINRISSALIKQDLQCINALDVLRALKDGLDQHASITKEERERYLNYISVARKEYDNLAKKEVQKAFVYSFEESAKTLFENYLDNIEAFCNWKKIRDPLTDEEMDPDERLMRSIEEQIGVSENAKKAFREEILIRLSSYSRKGRKFDYNSHERLREAVEKKLFADLKDIVKITTSTKTPDENQLKRINEVSARLMEEHGYCPVCANELLRYVGSLLNR
ncbi:PrkA family serine protein kinase [Paenibacillus melissococcoides]|uniref:PrkA family serine protein kinase n=1 Tax=Paenibacillus melissococcoides TaxID=2912268 RepID=A0ABN8U5K6_9BACL|nr:MULTISPECIES: PrkA family serine protein kinase [Paenibacillus]MEB9894161.1 PrkA family serine protein kinase [Bacillus cereus]CAH8246222.1 PrkA family serine protein kinase [Paenibacillus melissococcoides]CAH8713321.1 PrkA family serine protein kinase [Paenibacillus melissococcoides]CAH8714056.1 PrkA family serine protein kinase [Paenibacillus melissococcoides]GIO80449.1 protein PrkA [Paenibacillus dendritiformis]